MEVKVSPRNLTLTWVDGNFEMIIKDFCFYVEPFVKPFREALSAGIE